MAKEKLYDLAPSLVSVAQTCQKIPGNYMDNGINVWRTEIGERKPLDEFSNHLYTMSSQDAKEFGKKNNSRSLTLGGMNNNFLRSRNMRQMSRGSNQSSCRNSKQSFSRLGKIEEVNVEAIQRFRTQRNQTPTATSQIAFEK